ncbi:MAG: hypothetical protein JWQ48_2064 [Conexibacter sp.]|nr:hypothetical protein [Conexibacter sp.]
MQEILPGLYEWTAMRETIHQPVHSAYVVEARTLIDPMVPTEGLAAFDGLPRPERIVLTNRHHVRHSAPFVERFRCTVACNAAGLWDLADAPVRVGGFEFGDEVAPGIVAEKVGTLTQEETALHIALGPGALAFADSLIRDHGGAGSLAFFPDGLLGSDPVAVRRGLLAAFQRLVDDVDFDVLLLAHGAPIVGGGKRALREFIATQQAQLD